ncbi:MAG: hypothetical protein A3K68_00315 [Euryarchaeota archaeon RBG_16_68_13]|nr:MAG: hypothetical protein A3K68_00315 [Euryarchaeota archaeon RBG_16_68_13]
MPRTASTGPRDVVDVGLIVFASTLMALEAVRVFLAGVYAMNVLTMGLNLSVLAIALLLVPVAYLVGLARVPAGHSAPLFALALLASRLALLIPWPVPFHTALSGLCVASFLLFLVPFLAGVLRLAGGAGAVASGFGLALAADLALRTLGGTLDPGATPWSALYLVPLGALLAHRMLRIPLPRAPDVSMRAGGPTWVLGVGLGGLLSLVVLVLAYPHLLARWSGQPARPFEAALLLGLAGGSYLARMGFGTARRSGRWSVALALALLLFAADLAFVQSGALVVLAFLAAVAVPTGLERLLSWSASGDLSVKTVGSAFVVATAVLLLSLLAFVFSLTYAYVPASSLWRGSAPAVLILSALACAVPVLVASGRSPAAIPSPASRRWTALLAASVLLLGSAGLLATPARAPVDPGTDLLRVMTFNVHQGFDASGRLDVGGITDVVRLANPDLLALQESDTVRVTSGGVDLVGYIAGTLGYHAAYGPPTREQTYGVAILSRLPIESWSYRLLASEGDQRALVHARLATVRGPLDVVAVHLGLDPRERETQVRQVLAFADSLPGPTVLLGDFNACPSGLCARSDDAPDHVYEEVVAAFGDAWVDAGHPADDPAGFTYHALDPYERIDYAFVSSDLSVVSCTVFRDPSRPGASDHLPVLATVRLP